MNWIVLARGHLGITAKHRTTFMVTKEREVGPRGDCIIAVGADKAVSDLAPELKHAIRAGHEFLITLKVGEMVEKIRARGHPSLTLDHSTDIVVRKSKFTCGRTLAIGADKAAADLPIAFITKLRSPRTKVHMLITMLSQT